MPNTIIGGTIVLPDKETIHFPEDTIFGSEIETDFILSASERLDCLEEVALLWEKSPSDTSYPDAINRHLHSIKGDSGFIGLYTVAQIIHDIESAVIENQNNPPIDVLFCFKDWFVEVLGHLQGKPASPSEEMDFGVMRTLVMENGENPVKGLLKEMGEYQTVSADSEVLESIQKAWEEHCPYNLIFLPTGTPDNSGRKVLESIRELEEARGIFLGRGAAVVMISDVKDPKDVFRAFNLGCDIYLIRPFTKEKFLKEFSKLRWPRMND